MIIVNNHGRPRLVKLYQNVVRVRCGLRMCLIGMHHRTVLYSHRVPFRHTMPRHASQIGEEAQQSVIRKVFQQVAQRPDSFCNYLEGRCVRPCLGRPTNGLMGWLD